MDQAAASPLGLSVLPDAALRTRIVHSAAGWAHAPEAQVQHLQVLGEQVAALEATGGVAERLDDLATRVDGARRMLARLRAAGVSTDPVHATSLGALELPIRAARTAERI